MPTDIRFSRAPRFELREFIPIALFSGSGILASLVVILSVEGF